MPRLIDHPRASFKNGQEIAASVDYLGGSCTIESCAERMNKKVSGAFKALISAGVKHGLVTLKKEALTTTDLYRTLKHAYNDEEKIEVKRKAFLVPPLYHKIYERFKGKELPITMLSKLLIREFGVEEVYGSKVAGYFIDGAKSVGMLENGKLVDNIKASLNNTVNENDNSEDVNDTMFSNKEEKKANQGLTSYDSGINISPSVSGIFMIAVVGPGINTKIEINEEDDLLILESVLNKIRKKIKEGSK